MRIRQYRAAFVDSDAPLKEAEVASVAELASVPWLVHLSACSFCISGDIVTARVSNLPVIVALVVSA